MRCRRRAGPSHDKSGQKRFRHLPIIMADDRTDLMTDGYSPLAELSLAMFMKAPSTVLDNRNSEDSDLFAISETNAWRVQTMVWRLQVLTHLPKILTVFLTSEQTGAGVSGIALAIRRPPSCFHNGRALTQIPCSRAQPPTWL